MTIQVKHIPRKQVIIHEIAQYDNAEQMVINLSIGVSPGVLPPIFRWVNGVLLTFNAIPANPETFAKERVKGILRWDHVSFAPMKKYQRTMKGDNNISIDIVDVSNNETFEAIGKFLKKKIR